MTHDKDEVWGTPARRPLTPPRTLAQTKRLHRQESWPRDEADPQPDVETNAYGPEAYERAQTMAYERMTRIQQESPYGSQEVYEVEHVVHDHRLYIGMWLVAGIAALSAFFTHSVPCLAIMIVALLFALPSTPGRQHRD